MNEAVLRAFLARILGWERTQAIEHALRSIRLSVTHCAALLLLGDVEADLVSVARALHRLALGAAQPFVVCDRLRHGDHATVDAARSARGGSLCVRRRRLPDDFSAAVPVLRDPTAAVQLIICADASFDSHLLATLPVPIVVPSIQTREGELPRIVDEYALDAIAALDSFYEFSDVDRSWVLSDAARTLAEIEMATMRLVALRMAGSITEAAMRLGMKAAALRGWIHIRKINRRGEAVMRRGP